MLEELHQPTDHVSSLSTSNSNTVWNVNREGRTRHVGRPQDQLRQVRITSSSAGAVVPSRGDAASYNRRYSSSGSTQTVTHRPVYGVPSNPRRVLAARNPNAGPSQNSNRGHAVRTNPRVQDQQKRWYQQPNLQQSAARNRFTPARTPTLNRAAASPQSGPAGRPWASRAVKATRLSRRRGPQISRVSQTKQRGQNNLRGPSYNQLYSRRQGAAQSSPSRTRVVKIYDDPVDPRYKDTVNYVMQNAYGRVTIKRLKPERRPLQYAPPPRRDPPSRRQRVWPQRTGS